MKHLDIKRISRTFAVVTALAALLSVGTGSVFAGEITGNGTLKPVNGQSSCAFSGQQDLQWFYDDLDTLPKPVVTRGDPSHAQSWGQIDKATRDFLTTIGMNPGIACNPQKSSTPGA
jgi:hypothetical protein